MPRPASDAMTWRAPNRLRAVRRRQPDRINGFVHAVLAAVALVIFIGLLVGALVLGLLLVNSRVALSQPASGASEKTVIQDCTWDALRYCKRAIPQGRDSIIHCMILNKELLRPICSRHFW